MFCTPSDAPDGAHGDLGSHVENGILEAYFRIPKLKRESTSIQSSQTDWPEDSEIC